MNLSFCRVNLFCYFGCNRKSGPRGSAGHSGRLNFLCKNILNSSGEKLFVLSVQVESPNGIDVSALSADGMCFWACCGKVFQVDFNLSIVICFWMFFAVGMSSAW